MICDIEELREGQRLQAQVGIVGAAFTPYLDPIFRGECRIRQFGGP